MRATLSSQWVTCIHPCLIIPFDKRIGLKGLFSTNIPGNRDGEVREDPISFKSKDETGLAVLQPILQPELYPMLCQGLYDAVHINYYSLPRPYSRGAWGVRSSTISGFSSV